MCNQTAFAPNSSRKVLNSGELRHPWLYSYMASSSAARQALSEQKKGRNKPVKDTPPHNLQHYTAVELGSDAYVGRRVPFHNLPAARARKRVHRAFDVQHSLDLDTTDSTRSVRRFTPMMTKAARSNSARRENC